MCEESFLIDFCCLLRVALSLYFLLLAFVFQFTQFLICDFCFLSCLVCASLRERLKKTLEVQKKDVLGFGKIQQGLRQDVLGPRKRLLKICIKVKKKKYTQSNTHLFKMSQKTSWRLMLIMANMKTESSLPAATKLACNLFLSLFQMSKAFLLCGFFLLCEEKTFLIFVVCHTLFLFLCVSLSGRSKTLFF